MRISKVIRNARLTRDSGFAQPMLSVFCRYIGREAQFYTIRGEWVQREVKRAQFSVSGFFAPPAVESLLELLPQTVMPTERLYELQLMGVDVPTSVGAPLIESMLNFQLAADKVYREYSRKLDNAYNVMAPETIPVYATTLQIASKLLEVSDSSRIPNTTLWAVHRALRQDHAGFRLIVNRFKPLFEILPRRITMMFEEVKQWLRQYQESVVVEKVARKTNQKVDQSTDNPMPGFIKKARTMILINREHRNVIRITGISPDLTQLQAPISSSDHVRVVALSEFTKDEIVIIRFLVAWSLNHLVDTVLDLNSLGSMILRYIDMYPGHELGRATAVTLLKELGVIPPWENSAKFAPELGLCAHDTGGKRLLHESRAYATGWKPEDRMGHLRRDWGELEVFCIDHADANVIDDGISLERVPDDASQSWVHVHVANPTAFISPEDPLAKQAAHLSGTVYFPERIYHMLDSQVVQDHFSLANNRPTLTFSARLNTAGEILETMITPGIVRNVHRLDLQSLIRALGLTPDALQFKLNVGGIKSTTPPAHNHGEINESQRATLSKLNKLSEALYQKRESRGGSILSQLKSSGGPVKVSIPEIEPTSYIHGRKFIGDPMISYDGFIPQFTGHFSLFERSPESLVADLMILAGEVAAMWCKQRHIPALYKGLATNPDLPNPEEYKERFIDPQVAKNGTAPIENVWEYLSLIGKSITSSKPVRHSELGIDGYLKVTSPLRRFSDMINHWQIEAAIRHENFTSSSLIGSMDDLYPPFTRSQIDEIIPNISIQEIAIRNAQRRSIKHWRVQLLFRAYYFKEAILPDPLRIIIFRVVHWKDGSSRNYGTISELALSASLSENETSKEQGGIHVGDVWQCAIESISTNEKNVIVYPVALVKRGEGNQISGTQQPLLR